MSEKQKELYRYFAIGLSTTLINIGCYALLINLRIDYKIANLTAIILCKVYGYFANKIFVFRSRCDSLKAIFLECLRYIVARGFTAIVDYVGMIVVIEMLGWNKMVSKYILQLIVIILNYIFGKYMVFR